MPPSLNRVRARLGRGDDADRQFAGILAAILDDGVEAVEAACGQALGEGLCSRDAILNILARRRDAASPPRLATPGLALRFEPMADCARYDRLREREADHGAA